ncbi:metal-dependent hydrolase [bacterium]|nr:metal-dependent hydrolase [bacterium]
MDIRYLGHSAFQFKVGERSILVDPFVKQNDKYDWHAENITDIFVTHGHADHVGDTIEIAREKGSTVSAVVELADYFAREGLTTNRVNFGSWLNYPWGRAIFVPAFHSNSLPDGGHAGQAAGIIFDIEGVRIYHAGDTALTSEMKLIKELYHPTIAMLPIGGHYTMDIGHAAVAAEWLGARTVIPMHYNTFPEIKADLETFYKLVNMNNTGCLILNPDEIPNQQQMQ